MENLEYERRMQADRLRVSRLADTLLADAVAKIETALPSAGESPQILQDCIIISLDSSGRILLPRARLILGSAGAPLAAPPLNGRVMELIEQARTAEAQKNFESAGRLYAEIAGSEPALRTYAELARAHLRLLAGISGFPEMLANPPPDIAERASPGNLPLAILAADYVEDVSPQQRRRFAPAIRRALDLLRGGNWWLGLEQRSIYDEKLRRLLAMADGAPIAEDATLSEFSRLEAALRRALPILNTGVTRRYDSGQQSRFLLLWTRAPGAPGAWLGAAIPGARLDALLNTLLRPLVGEEPFKSAINDSDGAPVWNPLPAGVSSVYAAPLKAVPGWHLEFNEPPDQPGAGSRRLLWYGFIGLLLSILAGGFAGTVAIVRREVQLMRLQSDFVGSVTHDFKSPITSIQLLVERLRSGRLQTQEGAGEYYGAISRETDRLDRLVSRILESQKIQAGQRQYRFSPASVADLAEAAVRRIRPQAQAKEIGIRLEIADPAPEQLLDAAAIDDVLDNLLDNAIKYSPPGTRVDIAVNTETGYVAVEVRDQGIGIDPADIPRIFERFYRGRRPDQHGIQGTGLGLANARAAVEAHNGKIEAANIPGGGARFRICLPLRKEENGQGSDHR